MLTSARFISLADQGAVSMGNFLTTVLVARVLGASSLGDYLILLSISFFVQRVQAAVICMPMATSVKDRTISEEDETRFLWYATWFTVALIFLLPLISGAVRFFLLGTGMFPGEWWMIYIGIIGQETQEFMRRLLIARNSRGKAVALSTLYDVILITLLWLTLSTGAGNVDRVFLVIFIASLPSVILFMVLLVRRWNHAKIGVKQAIRQMRREYGLLGHNLTQWASAQYIYYAVYALLGAKAVGVLGAMRNLFGPVNIVILSFEGHLPFSLGRRFLHSKWSGLRTAIAAEIKMVTLGMVALGVFFLFAGEYIVHFLYGSEFVEHILLIWQFWTVCTLALSIRILLTALRVIGQANLMAKISIISLCSLVVVSAMLIPLFKIYGAAFAMVSDKVIMLALMILTLSKIRKKEAPKYSA